MSRRLGQNAASAMKNNTRFHGRGAPRLGRYRVQGRGPRSNNNDNNNNSNNNKNHRHNIGRAANRPEITNVLGSTPSRAEILDRALDEILGLDHDNDSSSFPERPVDTFGQVASTPTGGPQRTGVFDGIPIKIPRNAPHRLGLQPRKGCLKRLGTTGADKSRPRRVRISAEASDLFTRRKVSLPDRDRRSWIKDTKEERALRKRTSHTYWSNAVEWAPSDGDVPMTGVSEAENAAAAQARAEEEELDRRLAIARQWKHINKSNSTVIASKRERHLHPCLHVVEMEIDEW